MKIKKLIICYTILMEMLHCNYKVLGNLIRYYREEKKITRNELISYSNNKFSLSTLRRIENGDLVSFTIFQEIAKSLNLNVSLNMDDYILAEDYIKKTYNLINSGKPINEYYVLLNELKEFRDINLDKLYLRELVTICVEVLNMYLYCEISDVEIIKVIESSTIDSYSILNELSYYLLNLYGIYCTRGTTSSKKYLYYGNKLVNSKLYFLDIIFFKSAFLNRYDLHAQSKEYFNSLDFIKNQYMIDFKKCFIDGNIEIALKEYDEAKKHFLKAIQISEEIKCIAPRFTLHAREGLGILYVLLNDYQKAYDTFKYIYENNNRILELSYLLFFYSAEKTNNLVYIKKVIEENRENIKKHNEIVKNIFEYYYLKITSNDIKLLQDFIIENFSISNCKSKNCYLFFKQELSILIDETKAYRKYYEFIKENDFNYQLNSIDFIDF